jgi:hypothetical protein
MKHSILKDTMVCLLAASLSLAGHRTTYAGAEADAEAHIRAGCSRPAEGRRAWVVGPH